MRELIEKEKRVTIVPADMKCANKGLVVDTEPRYFTVKLDYEPKGIMRHNYCEFYMQTSHGTLYFDTFAENIDGNTIKFANPAKHRFLQRRQYTRIKYVYNLDLCADNLSHKITSLDISAGGMKLKTAENINIEGRYAVTLPLSEKQSVQCLFSPIRIEKSEEGGYIISGRFEYNNGKDKMTLTQYCTKRAIEIRNK